MDSGFLKYSRVYNKQMDIQDSQNKYILGALGAGVLIIIVTFAWWFFRQKRVQQEAIQTAELSSSLDAITATASVEVPTTADPLKSATPAINPIEKTNPFNNEYQNPFQ